ncbi:MAG: peptidoglycan bridge formation glycyltransferase FemA/FemB family protein [Armatimonadota bacterium]|nr:peptidoglycan bridge formation glycyltransferase FemA/FemB family protein [Armatimonadota bacterium]
MEYKLATEEDRQRFNKFVADFDWGDLLQSFEWGDLKSRSGWIPIRVYAEQSGRIVAAASILKRQIPRTSRCIMYAPRGPVLDTHNVELVNSFCGFLRDLAVDHRAILLKIDPPIPIEDTTSETNLRNAGFRPVKTNGFGGTQPKCVMQLDLDKSLDELLASFKPKWRYNIRLAQRKGVTVRLDCTKADLRPFYELLVETARRDGFLVREFRYFEDMWDCLVPPGYMRLALAYYQGEPIAGAIAYIFGNKAWYVYGASANQHRNVMPNHLVQWTLISWAKESGCKWYDFRGVSPRRDPRPDDRLQGLNRFKEGFSPRFVEYIGEYDMVIAPGLYWLWSFARPRVQAMLKLRRKLEATSEV